MALPLSQEEKPRMLNPFLRLNIFLKALMLSLKIRARKGIDVVDDPTHHQGVIVMVSIALLYLF